jgi:hypothetical protein
VADQILGFTKTRGSIVPGGYDQPLRFNNSVMTASPTDVSAGPQSVVVDRHYDTAIILEIGILAVRDTTVPELWLPPHVCDQTASAVSLSFLEAWNRYTLTYMTHSAPQTLDLIF